MTVNSGFLAACLAQLQKQQNMFVKFQKFVTHFVCLFLRLQHENDLTDFDATFDNQQLMIPVRFQATEDFFPVVSIGPEAKY